MDAVKAEHNSDDETSGCTEVCDNKDEESPVQCPDSTEFDTSAGLVKAEPCLPVSPDLPHQDLAAPDFLKVEEEFLDVSTLKVEVNDEVTTEEHGVWLQGSTTNVLSEVNREHVAEILEVFNRSQLQTKVHASPRESSESGSDAPLAPGDKVFTCEECQKSFNRHSELLKHIRTHTGEKPFKCKMCSRRFSVRSNLVRHLRTHTGDKPFKCEVCGRGFAQHGGVVEHMRTHTDDKPFKCTTCGKRCIRQSELLLHLRTHTGEKPFSCEQCGKSFTRRGTFQRHVQTHKNGKSFRCDLCDRRFTRNATLLRHVQARICDKLFTCDLCGIRFNEHCELLCHRCFCGRAKD